MSVKHVWLKVLLSAGLAALCASTALAQVAATGQRKSLPKGDSFYYGESRPRDTNAFSAKTISKVGWTQNLDAQVPQNLSFRDSNGKAVKLEQYFGSKPVLLELVYFRCPFLCGEVMRGTFSALRKISLKAGSGYEYVVVSINPGEGPKLAAKQKAHYLKQFKMTSQASGIHFLTGEKANIDKLAKTVGFNFDYDPKTKQFAHPAGLVLTSPAGKITRYMGGVLFDSHTLKLNMLSAGQGKVGSPLDLLQLKCYFYDGEKGQYTLAVMKLIRVGGLATLALIALMMVVLVRRDMARTRQEKKEEL